MRVQVQDCIITTNTKSISHIACLMTSDECQNQNSNTPTHMQREWISSTLKSVMKHSGEVDAIIICQCHGHGRYRWSMVACDGRRSRHFLRIFSSPNLFPPFCHFFRSPNLFPPQPAATHFQHPAKPNLIDIRHPTSRYRP